VTTVAQKRRYASDYGAKTAITAAQKLAEIACGRIAGARERHLPARFWKIKEWLPLFSEQVCHANALLKIYPPEAIFRALDGTEGRYIRSLGAPHLDPLIQREAAKLASERQRAAEAPPIEVADTTTPPRPPAVTGRSARAKLRESG
jgi:hypothetical protein